MESMRLISRKEESLLLMWFEPLKRISKPPEKSSCNLTTQCNTTHTLICILLINSRISCLEFSPDSRLFQPWITQTLACLGLLNCPQQGLSVPQRYWHNHNKINSSLTLCRISNPPKHPRNHLCRIIQFNLPGYNLYKCNNNNSKQNYPFMGELPLDSTRKRKN